MAEVRRLESGNLQCDSHTLIYDLLRTQEGTQSRRRATTQQGGMSQSVMGYHAISDRILLVKIHGQPFDLSIIQVYAPTSASTEEEMEYVYSDLEMHRANVTIKI